MITDFRRQKAEKIFGETRSRKLPCDIQQGALNKLNRIRFATAIEDSRAFPGINLFKKANDE